MSELLESSYKDADEEEVFDINDFTTASDWERFVANVEEVLHDWQLSGSSSSKKTFTKNDDWQEQLTTVKFADYEFIMTHHFKTYEVDDGKCKDVEASRVQNEKDEEDTLPNYIKEMMAVKNDFPSRAHCLERWFGLDQFITFVPSNQSQPIVSASKMKILLSSLSLSANNTNCEIPMFAQVSHIYDKIFLGIGVGSGVRTSFDMSYLRTPPVNCTHLAGLMNMFKDKIGVTIHSPFLTVSIRFTYILSDWPHTSWTQQPPDLDATLSDVGFRELGKLPFGALSDPVSELQLSTTWPRVIETILRESESQTLNPLSASSWSARLGAASPPPPCLLSEYVNDFYEICFNEEPIVQILGHDFDPTLDDGSNIVSALDRLTAPPVPTISSVVSKGFRSRKTPKKKVVSGPIPEETLTYLLNFLFPDSDLNEETIAAYEDPSLFSQVPQWTPSLEALKTEHPLKVVLKSMKTCGVDSFVWRLSVVLCHIVQSLGGLPAVAHLYYEILLELRFRCDNAVPVPGVPQGVPDLATCLFHQKLQMINCCINHRLQREKRNREFGKETTDEEEDDDEFFECCEEEEVEGGSCSSERGGGEEEEEEEEDNYTPSWDKPEGRSRKLEKEKLLKRNSPLYIPITQEAAPLTEDRLEEHTEDLLRLGTEADGASRRARMMSSALLSDMESFKAANPGCVLEDFVRWYSPRDWIEESTTDEGGRTKTKQYLSQRMKIQGNLWHEVWENAKPVPARRQKRLFDDTREIEKVIEWLHFLSPGTLCLQLFPVVLHCSLCRVAEEEILYTLPAELSDQVLPNPLHSGTLAAQLEVLSQRVSRLSRQPTELPKYAPIIEQLALIERSVAKAQSLRLKLLGDSRISEDSFKYINAAQDMKTREKGNQPATIETNEEKKKDKSVSKEEEDRCCLEKLVFGLLDSPEVELEGCAMGIQGITIRKLFSDAEKALVDEDILRNPNDATPLTREEECTKLLRRDLILGKPAGREYLLRGRTALPAYHSRENSQRMYAVLLKNSFRLCGAISQDSIFC